MFAGKRLRSNCIKENKRIKKLFLILYREEFLIELKAGKFVTKENRKEQTLWGELKLFFLLDFIY
ncbi:hypothetical protein BTS2_1493 [Bacillus sp. TS-2]|nr:hypothetical protein BTS2_1493 [Bacillus sp. TS-2]